MDRNKAEAMVWACFAGDALALGAHWEYDPVALAARHGRVTEFLAPAPGSYHEGKGAGDFTHYGDQTLVLLDSLAARQGFDLEDFARRWRGLFADYAGYLDGATRRTLEFFEFGEGPASSGSASNDLAGASRLAPLLLCHGDDEQALVAAAAAQTRMTHNNALVLDSAAFFARACRAALAGADPVEALVDAAKADYPSAPIGEWLEQGLASAGRDTTAAIEEFGSSCHVPEAFPGVVHLTAKYRGDVRTGLIECVMAGGDSAARAMLAGPLLAASDPAGLPESWISGLARSKTIAERMKKL